MKNILAIFILLQLANAAYSQIVGDTEFTESIGKSFNTSLEQANYHFEQFSYTRAIELYNYSLEEDGDNDVVKLKIAESYRKLINPEQAVKWYAQVIGNDQVVEPIHKLYYAQSLSGIGNYEEAKQWYQQYQQAVSSDQRGTRKLTAIENIADYYTDSSRYTLKPVSINSLEADFSPTFYEDGIVFVSARSTEPWRKNIFSWNQKSYLDLYYCRIKENGDFEEPQKFDNKVNTKYHEGPSAFYDEYRKVIFTRNNYHASKVQMSEDEVIKLKLFYGERSSKDGSWENIGELPFNSDEYSIGHPTLSEDGRTLYFVSDMPGGYGGTDIYKTTYNSDSWSQPENLGANVNSEGNEMFPFLFNDSRLYFASEGYGGLGGYDLYYTDMNSNQAPINMGYPINTNSDDFGLILDQDGRTGYFTSNRKGGAGDDDLYAVIIRSVAVEAQLANRDESIIIDEEEILVVDKATGRSIPFTKAGDKISFEGIPGKEYEVQVNKEGYQNNSKLILPEKLSASEERVTTNIPVEKQEPKVAAVPVKKGVESIDILIVENISGEVQTFTIVDDSLMHYEGSVEDIQASLGYQGIEVGELTQITNIYYDLDRSNIRTDAKVQMDRLAHLMTKSSQIRLFLHSHTDSRADDGYNLALSKRRSLAAMNYLVKKGINRERITKDSFGEKQLVNDCASDKQCSEEQHQFNRRTEFKITIGSK